MKRRFFTLLACLLLLWLLPAAAYAAEVIDHVEAETYIVPFVGDTIPKGMSALWRPTLSSEHVKLMTYDWKDLTEDRFTSYLETFQEGHSYRLLVKVNPDPGSYYYTFSADTTATINGFPAQIWDWGTDYFTFYYDFPMYFNEFEITGVPEPAEPNKPSYSFTLPEGAHYTFDDSKDEFFTLFGAQIYNTRNGVSWYRKNKDSSSYSEMSETISFRPFNTYRVEVRLKPKDGYAFDEFTTHGTINGKPALVTSVGPDGSWIKARVDFDPFGEYVDTVAYTVTEPEAGMHPDFFVEPADWNQYTLSAVEYANYAWGVAWYDNADEVWLDEASTFVQDHDYTVYIHAAHASNHRFTVDSLGESSVTATINGCGAAVEADKEGDQTEGLILSCTFDCACAKLRQVRVTVDTPRPGLAGDHAPRIPEDARYRLVTDDADYPGGARWVDPASWAVVEPTQPLEYGREYWVYFKLEPENTLDCLFPANAAEIDAQVNDKSAEIEMIGSGGESIVVKTAFTVDYNYIPSVVFGLAKPASLSSVSFNAFAGRTSYEVEDYDEDDFHNGVCWSDDTAGMYLAPGDTFIGGHTYTVWISAVTSVGSRFNVPLTSAMIGSEEATIVGENSEDAVVVKKTWTCPLTPIDDVALNVTTPVDGDTPSFTVWHGFSAYTVSDVVWTDVKTGEELDEDSVFAPAAQYKLYATLEAKDGCSFVCDGDGDPLFKATINGKTANIDKILGKDASKTVRVSFTFTAQAEVIKTLPFDFDPPKAGGYPFWTFGESDRWAVIDAVWKDGETGDVMDGVTPFEAKEYLLQLTLYAAHGYAFLCDANGDPTVEVTINGAPAFVQKSGESDAHKTILISLAIDVGANEIYDVFVDAAPPLPGEHPDFEPEAYPDCEAVGMTWTDVTTGTSLGKDGVFVVGHEYRATAVVRANVGYVFGTLMDGDDLIPGVTAAFNDSALPAGDIVTGPGGNPRFELALTRTFSCVEQVRRFEASFTGYEPGATPADVTVTLPAGVNYVVDECVWIDQQSDSPMLDSDAFAADQTYTLEIHLRRTGGAPFEATYNDDTSQWEPSYYTDGVVNGRACMVVSSHDRDGRDYLALRFYAGPCGRTMIEQVSVDGLLPIEYGMTLQEYRDSLALSVPADAPYTVGTVYNGDMKPTDMFDSGYDQVTLEVEINTKPGCAFWSLYDSYSSEYMLLYGIEAAVNGEESYILAPDPGDPRFTVLAAAKVPVFAAIHFEPCGGTGAMAPARLQIGSSCALPACAFTAPAGREFKCWNVNGEELAPGQSFTLLGNTNVMAVWKTVSFAINKLTVAGGTVHFSATAPEGAKLVAAAYDASGRMLRSSVCADLSAESIPLNAPAGSVVKAFLINKSGRPLCAAKTAE